MQIFNNRKLVIATQHKKENVIAPILEKELGVSCFVNENFDTDTLGTFTGEVERELDPLSTARAKCLLAMELSNCDLGIASEGSFGAHPSMFFVQADEEFLIFIDTKNDLEIVVKEISTSTNFNGKIIENEKELFEFAHHVGFPSHGIILRPSKNENSNIHKGIIDKETLQSIFENLKTKHNSVYAETDMRAMYNPTRMEVIKNATDKLIKKVLSVCSQCNTPGFGVTEAKSGLPCSLCSSPTNSTLSYLYVCKCCGFTKEEMYPHNKTFEDPTFCDYCNP